MTNAPQLDEIDTPIRVLETLTVSERAILDLVRRQPGLSRSQIAEQLALSPAMLTKAVTRFADAGLVTEEREARPRLGRGQPSLRLRIRVDAAFSLGISLSTTGVSVAAIDLEANVLGVVSDPCPATDVQRANEVLFRQIETLSARFGGPDRLMGIGLWVPALLDRTGQILEITPSQRDVDYGRFQSALQSRYDVPAYFENRAYARYEVIRPAKLGPVVFMVFLDFGVGGALVEDLQIYRGGHGYAANIGSMFPPEGPRPTLLDLANHLGVDPDALDDASLTSRFKAGDTRLLDWIDARGRQMSGPLSTVVQFFNPTDIVIGGLFPRALFEALIKTIDLGQLDHTGRLPLPKPALSVASVVGKDAMAIAAAAIPIAKRLGG